LYQCGDLDFLQGGRLREQTGKKLGYHTGGKAGRTYRIEAWTSNRGKAARRNRAETGTFHRG
jgi:hypothetical protein